jgi:hypothetical protein
MTSLHPIRREHRFVHDLEDSPMSPHVMAAKMLLPTELFEAQITRIVFVFAAVSRQMRRQRVTVFVQLAAFRARYLNNI